MLKMRNSANNTSISETGFKLSLAYSQPILD